MKYFFDTEFSMDEKGKPDKLISIGVVNEIGEAYYAESATWHPSMGNDWLRANVAPGLKGGQFAKSPLQISQDLIYFTSGDEEVEFWAFYGAYDWVFMCMLFDGMMSLPSNWVRHFYELKQYSESLGIDRSLWPAQSEEGMHNALVDAQWNLEVYNWIRSPILKKEV